MWSIQFNIYIARYIYIYTYIKMLNITPYSQYINYEHINPIA